MTPGELDSPLLVQPVREHAAEGEMKIGTSSFCVSSDVDGLIEEANNAWSDSHRSTSSVARANELNICCICLERQIECVLSCFHAYCRECIDEWKQRDPTCPLCREQETSQGGFDLLNAPDR